LIVYIANIYITELFTLKFCCIKAVGSKNGACWTKIGTIPAKTIAVARAFMNKPSIVLADEPFGNLDQKIGGHLGEMLFGLRDKEGTSLIIVTHDFQLANQADRIMKLKHGKLIPVEILP